MLVAIYSTSLPKLPTRLYLCLAQEYLAVIVRLGEGGEKCIKIKGNEKEDGKANTLATWKRSISIFL